MNNNLKNQERFLKRCLKRIISFNTETMVKFMITGSLALTLIGCGGGSNNTASAPPVIIPPSLEGELPELGIEKEWELVSGIEKMDYIEFENLLASGKIYEHNGKYYTVVDEG